jgi:pimeloyl-ACP methyl ester carboxylesterase
MGRILPSFFGYSASYVGSRNPSGRTGRLEAEDKFDFTERLAAIRVPTLVIGGESDKFYPLRRTAEGIPSAKLILYKNAGHMAMMKSQFSRDVLDFLSDGPGQ